MFTIQETYFIIETMIKRIVGLSLTLAGLVVTGFGVFIFSNGATSALFILLSGFVLSIGGLSTLFGRQVKAIIEDIVAGL